MKRIIALILVAALALSLAACQKENGEAPSSSSASLSEQASSNITSSQTVSSQKEERVPYEPAKTLSDYFDTLTFYDKTSDASIEYLFHEPLRDTGKEYPMIIFLHGLFEEMSLTSLGTAGGMVEALMYYENAIEKYSIYTLIPSTPLPSEGWWQDNQLEALKQLIYKLCEGYKIDKKRIYIAGISMGGMTACQLLDEMPKDTFAAIATFSGVSTLSNPEKALNTAVRIYHAENDQTVSPQSSRNLNQQLISAGHKNVEYTEFEGGDHLSAIKTVFTRQRLAFLDWMFAQKLP
ncbi:MAG: dienelactone hydrolase family protein [Clostridia bacterium]|nr:dienelactone hydrolase family protein [Clostridia bacterium]